jgi:hypothetical protein
MKTYTVKNKQHEQDNINFIDVNVAKEEIPSFLDYDEVLAYSLENGNITSAANIKSLCDGGDYVHAYFSENDAAHECEMYVEYTPFYTNDEDGNEVEKTLEFDSGIEEYELY